MPIATHGLSLDSPRRLDFIISGFENLRVESSPILGLPRLKRYYGMDN
jgi:hypothetical protein